ncbi:hypothetical protein ABFU82_26180 [Nocardioides sp. WV_118_6]
MRRVHAAPERRAAGAAGAAADDLVATEAWAAEIEAAFAPRALGAPGWDWAAVGLGQRDCRTLRS